MKNTKTIRSQLLGVVIDTVLVSLVLVIMTLVIYQHMEKGYETSTEQMLLLNSYYHTLEDINGDVYTYTLEGNESVYNEIAEKVFHESDKTETTFGNSCRKTVLQRYQRCGADVSAVHTKNQKDL